jgi:hypothetical protein
VARPPDLRGEHSHLGDDWLRLVEAARMVVIEIQLKRKDKGRSSNN